jgi:hypothetical protein
MTQDHFSGEARTVETSHEKERGPNAFEKMETGQTSKLYFLGWVDGQKYGDQPVFFSPLAGYAFALPAHGILTDKMQTVPKLSPCIVTCDFMPPANSGKSARYTVQVFDVVTEQEMLQKLNDAWLDFMKRVTAVRGGKAPVAVGPTAAGTPRQRF